MNEDPHNPWIHIGECPVCVNGLCRVRHCDGGAGAGAEAAHLYAMCDECEAIWIEPTTDSSKSFPDSENPQCPICHQDLFGAQARWALPADVCGTDWDGMVIFDVASLSTESQEPFDRSPPSQRVSGESEFLTPDDIPGALDAPPIEGESDRPTREPKIGGGSTSDWDVGSAASSDDDLQPGC